MHILILATLLATAILIYRGASRSLVITLWLVAAALMTGLFYHHLTDSLGLSF